MIGGVKVWMFNLKASSVKSKPDEIISTLEIKRGQTVADIGVGGGYFTLRFSESVGREGKVYAIDTNPEFLDFVEKNKGLGNIRTIHAADMSQIPKKALDIIFLRNVYHHLEDRVNYFKEASKYLKTNGVLAIIEYKECSGFRLGHLFTHPPHHHTSAEKINKEMDEAGYILYKTYDFLPEQSYNIYKKKMEET